MQFQVMGFHVFSMALTLHIVSLTSEGGPIAEFSANIIGILWQTNCLHQTMMHMNKPVIKSNTGGMQ
jgi:hypothetical protein